MKSIIKSTRPLFATVSLLCLVAAGVSPARASTPAGAAPSIEQTISFKNVAAPVISPDGRHVAYLVSETNWVENKFENEIWIAATASGRSYRLTNAKNSSYSPRWSPDGGRVAFLSDRDGSAQVYLISVEGGEPARLTDVASGVNAIAWSPDGRHIAYTASDAATARRQEGGQDLAPFDLFGDGPPATDRARAHLWMIDVPLAEAGSMPAPRRLTSGERFSVRYFRWAPDSRRIAFEAAGDPEPRWMEGVDLNVLDVRTGAVKKIVDLKGTYPVWSPDGAQIAFETMGGGPFHDYANVHVAVVPAEGGEARVLTRQFDERTDLLAWSPAGIYFAALQKTSNHLFRLAPATGEVERVTTPEQFHLQGISFTRDFSRIALVSAGATTYSEVYVTPLARFAPRRLTDMNEQYRHLARHPREVIAWKSRDGTPVEGVLIKPADFDPSRKYPLVVVIHGGPQDVRQPVQRHDYEYPIDQLAAKGALVLQPNYRGGIGYGRKFRSLNIRNFGVGDYEDVVGGVDYLIERGVVDRGRVGAAGWSQGGYIAAFSAVYGDRFRAVSAGAAVYDWQTYYTNSDTGGFVIDYFGGTPWDEPEAYRRAAVFSYLKSAKTPALIQHGESDRRAPTADAYKFYRALKDRGVPAEMIIYKGVGHCVQCTPKGRLTVMRHNLEWFSRWLWPHPATASTRRFHTTYLSPVSRPAVTPSPRPKTGMSSANTARRPRLTPLRGCGYTALASTK